MPLCAYFYIDVDNYKRSARVHERIVRVLCRLIHPPKKAELVLQLCFGVLPRSGTWVRMTGIPSRMSQKIGGTPVLALLWSPLLLLGYRVVASCSRSHPPPVLAAVTTPPLHPSWVAVGGECVCAGTFGRFPPFC